MGQHSPPPQALPSLHRQVASFEAQQVPFWWTGVAAGQHFPPEQTCSEAQYPDPQHDCPEGTQTEVQHFLPDPQ